MTGQVQGKLTFAIVFRVVVQLSAPGRSNTDPVVTGNASLSSPIALTHDAYLIDGCVHESTVGARPEVHTVNQSLANGTVRNWVSAWMSSGFLCPVSPENGLCVCGSWPGWNKQNLEDQIATLKVGHTSVPACTRKEVQSLLAVMPLYLSM